jgi:hypothetical protein
MVLIEPTTVIGVILDHAKTVIEYIKDVKDTKNGQNDCLNEIAAVTQTLGYSIAKTRRQRPVEKHHGSAKPRKRCVPTTGFGVGKAGVGPRPSNHRLGM